MIGIYGTHSKKWMDALNKDNLLEDLQKINPEIKDIININNFWEKGLINKCDIILPIGEAHAIEMNDHQIPGFVPEKEIIEKFWSKKEFDRYIEEHELNDIIPKTYRSYVDLKKEMDGLKKFIIKPNRLCGGENCEIVTYVSEDKFYNNVVQELIPNVNEYCVNVAAIKGKIIHCVIFRYTFENVDHVKNWSTPVLELIPWKLDEYIGSVERLLMSCEYTGLCNPDTVLHNGGLKIFEANPRFGGNLIRPEFKYLLVEMISEIWKHCKQEKLNKQYIIMDPI
jgi:predicted ATP-grasp superfamily ATP-dependent carboligase